VQDGTDTGDIPGDVTWMSYAELGRLRGISAASAKRLSNRRRWRKRSGNDGTTRVAVPAGEDAPRETVPGDVSGELSRLLVEANARADAAHQRTDAALAVADQTLAQLSEATGRSGEADRRAEAAETRADAAEADRRAADARAGAERARADQAEADRRAAEGRADTAGRRAEAAERDRREALSLVEQSAAGLIAERGKADGLRDRLVGAQAELSLVQAAADRARGEAQEALQRAEALEQAERARKARGRWARLRAAWRGE
jgi:hypothetical protein